MKLKILMFLFILVMAYQGVQAQNFPYRVPSPPMRAHISIQNYSSFPEWKKRQPRVRKKAARAAVKQRKRILKANKKIKRLLKFEDKLKTKIIKTH